MYSLMLMAAVASGPDATAFGGRLMSCHGCCGGYYAASCHGCYGGYASCYGCGGYSSCSGCCGGYANRAYYGSCTGSYASCYGSCYGSGYATGCYGSCYGSSYGSCYGSGYGSSYGSCYGSGYGYGYSAGCFGSCYGYGASYGAGCGGCFGSPYMGGTIINSVPTVTVPAAPETAPAPAADSADDSTQGMTANPGFAFNPINAAEKPALLTVEVPVGAKLYVDGRLTNGEGNARKFHTPALPAGKAFFYELKAEVEIAGRVETEEKRVIVRAGETLSESFPRLIAAAKTNRDTLVTADAR